ncbi:ATPase [Lentzea sp. PSKA42]|uniref:ATPase n=1 Tax=Lentzea indica TaxID=2604800 RepID=A0ABX1FIN5_9PSEU|nr:SRPBCC family protein [Lentzea indica]NKE58586.1 ATPase [Lentzea indica]
MPVDVRPEVLVRRPRSDVAAFMFDPANDLEWTGGITSSRPTRPGSLVEGATVERTARFLGREFVYGYVVTEHDQDRLVEMKVDRPFPMTVRYELADAPTGTLVAIHASGTPGGFFGWATPLMARQVRKSITADLERLRACLEP